MEVERKLSSRGGIYPDVESPALGTSFIWPRHDGRCEADPTPYLESG
jgi:hypothetical protein